MSMLLRTRMLSLSLVSASGIAQGETAYGDFQRLWGRFQIYWNPETEVISITDPSQGGRIIWQSLSFSDMVEGAQASQDIDFARGCFVFKEKQRKTCGKAHFISLTQDPNQLTWMGSFDGCGQNFRLTLSKTEMTHQIAFDLSLVDQASKLNRLKFNFSSLDSSDFYGFGHQYAQVNMKGKKLPIWAMEQGVGRGQQPLSSVLQLPGVGGGCQGEWHSSYTAVPFLTSPKGLSLYSENKEYLEFDFTKADRIGLEVWGQNLKGRILAAEGPKAAIQSLTEVSGRMGDLPSWTQKGLILRASGGSAAVRKLRDTLKAQGIAVAALWIEDWAGTRKTNFGDRMWWNWEVDRSLYPDWEQLINELRADDMHTMIYFNPFLADAKEKKNARRNLFAEAKAAGYLIKNAKGEVYEIANGGFSAGMIDLTHPGARIFLQDLMREQLAMGVSGWMADFGEALPLDSSLFANVDAYRFHNDFPLEWAKLNAEVVSQSGHADEILYFNRSGNLWSPGHTKAFWIGDQNTTWDAFDGIKTVIPALLSGGLSGYAIDHIDSGGWLSLNFPFVSFQRDKEMFLRWLELGAMTPLLRIHNTNLPQKNWQVDSDAQTLSFVAHVSKLFAALAPYRQTLFEEARLTGLPVLRHSMLSDPEDPSLRDLQAQMLMGDDLLVAPVLDKGRTQVSATLPRGLWRHVWTSTIYGSLEKSTKVEVPAPLGFPALFTRLDSPGESIIRSHLQDVGLLP